MNRTSERQRMAIHQAGHAMSLFDSEERLNAWAGQPVPFAIIAGHFAAAITTADLHWAINLDSGFAKELVPEEIAFLQSLPVPEAD